MTVSADQIDAYWRDGYLKGVPLFTADEIDAHLRALVRIEADEETRRGGEWADRDYQPWDQDDHPLFPWCHALATDARLLDLASAILGPNLLIRNVDLFVKAPRSRRVVGWHQDTAETGPDADGLLTLWVALTPATKASGCLAFLAGSHRKPLPGGPADRDHLTLRKEALSALDPRSIVFNELPVGHASVHHFRTVHASAQNRTHERRLSFVVRLVRPDVPTSIAETGAAMLVRGADTHGHYSLKPTFPIGWRV